jgi:hypothetical protein
MKSRSQETGVRSQNRKERREKAGDRMKSRSQEPEVRSQNREDNGLGPGDQKAEDKSQNEEQETGVRISVRQIPPRCWVIFG